VNAGVDERLKRFSDGGTDVDLLGEFGRYFELLLVVVITIDEIQKIIAEARSRKRDGLRCVVLRTRYEMLFFIVTERT
jgi:hypothetical protein